MSSAHGKHAKATKLYRFQPDCVFFSQPFTRPWCLARTCGKSVFVATRRTVKATTQYCCNTSHTIDRALYNIAPTARNARAAQ